jgi:hypothetical protein
LPKATVSKPLHGRRKNRIEELIDITERSASAPVYPLLKRPDERHVTMQAYDNPVFVEDMVRNVAMDLQADPRVSWFRVNAVNHESIHTIITARLRPSPGRDSDRICRRVLRQAPFEAMPLSLKQSQVAGALKGVLHDLLPGSGNKAWRGHVTFATVATPVGVGDSGPEDQSNPRSRRYREQA